MVSPLTVSWLDMRKRAFVKECKRAICRIYCTGCKDVGPFHLQVWRLDHSGFAMICRVTLGQEVERCVICGRCT